MSDLDNFYLSQPEPIRAGLLTEKRSRMKIMLFDPNKDLPIKTIKAILQKAIQLYETGVIKIR